LLNIDDKLLLKIKEYKEELKDAVVKKKEKLEKVGYKAYMADQK
jgi:5-(carboxyamino)imidazole ribonucleotide mutase